LFLAREITMHRKLILSAMIGLSALAFSASAHAADAFDLGRDVLHDRDRVQQDRQEFNRDSQRQQRHADEFLEDLKRGRGRDAAQDLGDIHRDNRNKREDVIDFNHDNSRRQQDERQLRDKLNRL
jgi:hypothetical protein